ncbi:MAG: Ca-activated chloride channel family protein [Planctomycetota bacterium]|jgi:Ca-activated chloride channel family protein
MFARPWMLLLLALPVLHLYWVWARRAGRFAMPFDSDGEKHLGSRWPMRALLSIGESLPALMMAVAVLLISLPQELAAPKQKRALTNIQFVVDISGSMTAKFGTGTRYDASMKAINEFLDFRSGDSFGLTFFGNNYLHWVPLTSDPSAFSNSIPFMRPENRVPGFGGTEIGKAVLGAREVLTSREEGDRMMILVTDGFSSDLTGGAEMEIARRLRRDRIQLFAVNIQESEARGEIVNLARTTGGEVFNPGDTGALKRVFAKIDDMTKTELEQASAELVDWFFPFAMVGLSLLGAYMLMLLGWRYTPW